LKKKRDYIKSQVVEAVRSEVEANVTAAVTEQVKAEVTKAVKEQVSEKVTANVRENVEEQVILAATGMNKASYYAAVSAGRVDAATQKAVKSAIDNKMASKEITDLISSNIDKQMQSEQVSAMISQKSMNRCRQKKLRIPLRKMLS